MRITTSFEGMPILVAEDDMLQALDLSNTFQDAGATVLGPATKVDEALDILDRHKCGAALLDFKFGRQTAGPLIDDLYRRRIPFVVHTGYWDIKMLPQKWPGCRVISKPSSIPHLIQTVAKLVRWRRSNCL